MNKTVLITGCSTGIGRACVEKFANEDWKVSATMRKTEKGKDLAKRNNVAVFAIDVTDENSVNTGVTMTIEKFGKIDAVINNAAYSEFGPIEFATDAIIERQYSTNVAGPIRVMRAVLPQMRKQGGGVIVNITSGAGRIGFPLTSLYCGTKFAIEGITESIQYELRPFGIRVKIVEPGFTNSEFMNNSNMGMDPSVKDYDSFIQKILSTYSSGNENYSTPDKIAEMIYQATIDESPRLRYPAGDDAIAFMDTRDNGNDETVFKMVMALYD